MREFDLEDGEDDPEDQKIPVDQEDEDWQERMYERSRRLVALQVTSEKGLVQTRGRGATCRPCMEESQKGAFVAMVWFVSNFRHKKNAPPRGWGANKRKVNQL